MKNLKQIFAALAAVLSLSAISAEAITGETVINPFYSDQSSSSDYNSWTFNAPWDNDGAQSRIVYTAESSGNTGVFTAVGAGRNLATASEITGDPGFTNADNALLTGVTLNAPFLNLFGSVDAGDYNLLFQLDIVTAGGTFRAQSQEVDFSTIGTNNALPLFMTYQDGVFLGDPSSQAGGGIALSDITSIDYRAVVNVISPTTGGAAFLTADNLSVSYDVSFVPEPGTYALLAGLSGLCFVMVTRRGVKRLSV
ncbi:MAG: PEP-CTERM sorting domain-containing protein [Lentimonas sp.]